MNDQNSSFWDDPEMDMIRAILDEDHTQPRELPDQNSYEQAYEPQPNRQQYQHPAPQNYGQPAPQNYQRRPQQPRPTRQSPARPQAQAPQFFDPPAQPQNRPVRPDPRPAYPPIQPEFAYRQSRPESGRKSSGKGMVVFLIILIFLELMVILGVCTSWYLWTH